MARFPSQQLHLPGNSDGARRLIPLCKLCDLHDWEEPEFLALCGEILARDPNKAVRHRKLWEFAQTVRALQAGGVLHARARGLSVAAGSERILFYLARYVERMVATDIYGSGPFAGREAPAPFLTNPEAYAPYPYPLERLRPIRMNALALAFEDDLFDFVFSLSSVEHFGGRANALAAVREMGRVTRPGGIIVVTTECAVNGWKVDQVFLPQDIERIVRQSGLELLEPIYWDLSGETVRRAADLRRDDLSALPHCNLTIFGSVFTSISLALRKPGPRRPTLYADTAAFDAMLARLFLAPLFQPKEGWCERHVRWLRQKAGSAWCRIREAAARTAPGCNLPRQP